MTTVREFSTVGPCIERGDLLRETAQFYVFTDKFGWSAKGRDQEARAKKGTDEHWSAFHTEPCPSCRDHIHSQYPNGYEN